MYVTRTATALALILAGATGPLPSTVAASGFSMPEASIAGLGLANTLAANPEERGAFAYNPAAMGFHTGSSLSVGTLFIAPSFSVETAVGEHDSRGADWIGLGLLQGALDLGERWRLGFGITMPFGLETRWRDGTFPAVSGTRTLQLPSYLPLDPVVPLGHPTSSRLEVWDIAPTATYRVNDSLSLSAGVDIYWAKTARFESTLADLDVDGTGLGFNLSALYRQGPWSLGAAFHSSSTLGLEGDYVPLSQTLVALGQIAPAQSAELDFALPWRLQIGLRHAFDERLAVEFDWTRTGWEAFNDFEVRGANGSTAIYREDNDWHDSDAYQVGLTYRLRPETQIRVGYTYGRTPQGDDHFSALVPSNDGHLIGVGLVQSLGHGLSLEAGYLYLWLDDRRYRSDTRYIGTALHGTDALDGDYSMHAHMVGLGLTQVF